MGIIDWGGRVWIYGTDKMTMQKCKISDNSECAKCNKSLPKGTICLGKAGIKFCLDCADYMFKAVEIEFKSFLKLMRKTKKDLELNKEEYEANNLVSSI